MLQYLIRLNRQFANFLYENRNIGLITGKEVIIANILNLGNLDQIKMNASKPKDSSFLEFLTCNTFNASANEKFSSDKSRPDSVTSTHSKTSFGAMFL